MFRYRNYPSPNFESQCTSAYYSQILIKHILNPAITITFQPIFCNSYLIDLILKSCPLHNILLGIHFTMKFDKFRAQTGKSIYRFN